MIEIISEWGVKEMVWLAAIFVTVMFFIIGCSMQDKADFEDKNNEAKNSKVQKLWKEE